MTDDETPAEPVADTTSKAVIIPPAPAGVSAFPFPVKAYRVVQTGAVSPANEPMDILEIEFGAPNAGNSMFVGHMDAQRMYVERKDTAAWLAKLGLK